MNQSERLNTILRFIEKRIPRRLFTLAQPVYHYVLAFSGAIIYRFPARKLHVVAVTGTNGKTSTTEFLYAIWNAHGHTAALSNSIRFVIAGEETRNTTKMALPGRFQLQRFLRKAVQSGCTYAVIEVSSEAAKHFRHRFVKWNGLIFTNLTPEHIESHGSFEKYKQAKLSIARSAANSGRQERILSANADDPAYVDFAALPFTHKELFSLKDAHNLEKHESGSTFTIYDTRIELHIPSTFNIYNALAAAAYAHAQGIPAEAIKNGLGRVREIPGRLEYIETSQPLDIVVDYAHTPESLEAVYNTFKEKRKICVLGNAGGGRDKWKRSEMAKIADTHCEYIILTNEDPYDEDPRAIVEGMRAHIKHTKADIIMDRRKAIRAALAQAQEGDAVLITGKGTDPFIMGPNNTKQKWSDADVVREEIQHT